MASTSTVFSHRKYNGRQSNQGNTVLINIGQLRSKSDLWCLGYLQDIEGDQALIDLDCTQFPPFWISTQYVWYHHLLNFGFLYRCPLHPPSLQVHVALRSELDGAYIFRPALLLNRPVFENLYVCCVIMQTTDAGNGDNQEVQVVHHWQVVQSLPTDEPPLLGSLRQTGSLDEIPVLKQIVHTANIDIIQTIPERRIKSLVSMAVKRAGFWRNGVGLFPRMFVAIGKGDFMVLLFDLHRWGVTEGEAEGEAGQREWTVLSVQGFALEIEKWYKKTDETAPDVSQSDTSIRADMVLLHGLTDEAEPTAGILPWEILSEVLLSLDFHSQFRAKRVCSLWYSLLRIKPTCAVIDFAIFGQRNTYDSLVYASQGYSLGTLVDRAISQKTKVLGLFNIDVNKLYGYDDPTRILEIILNLLALKQVGLLAIMLKNCRFLHELSLTWEEDDFLAHELLHVSKLLPVCERLFLSNHTTSEYLAGCDCGVIHGRITDPQYIPVTFPSLEFHRCAGERASIMRFVEALEPQLPSVDEIKTRIKERHQFFVETVPYPDGWQGFRQFLRRHTFTELSALDSFWNELDLRNFDQLPLTKMVLLSLEDCIDAVFENV